MDPRSYKSDVTLAWQRAIKNLGIRASTPFTIQTRNGPIECIAYLQDFGGERGMIIAHAQRPDYSTDQQIIDYARREGLFFSFVTDEYARYDEERFKGTLRDWNFFGPSEVAPNWLGDEQQRSWS